MADNAVENIRNLLMNEMQKFLRISNDKTREQFNQAFQKALIGSLLDGTVFAIVESLGDMQIMTERHLYANRQKRLTELQLAPDLDERMRQIDLEILQELDKMTALQQDTLARAGVPGFRQTMSPREMGDIIGFIYAGLLIVGGIIGYAKKGSLISIVAGTISGSAIGYGAYTSNYILISALSGIISISMGYRFSLTGKSVPAVVAAISAVMFVRNVLLAIR